MTRKRLASIVETRQYTVVPIMEKLSSTISIVTINYSYHHPSLESATESTTTGTLVLDVQYSVILYFKGTEMGFSVENGGCKCGSMAVVSGLSPIGARKEE